MPFSLIAMCHSIHPFCLFLLLWTGTESAVAMFLPEIEALVCTTLRETQSWHLKAQAAAAIATLAEKAGTVNVGSVCVCVCVCVCMGG